MNTDDPNIKAIRDSFARVVYSHKTYEKARELAGSRAEVVKWTNLILTTVTSGTLLSTLITNQKILLYVGSAFAAATLAFTIFQLSFDPAKEAERYRATAKELWYVREKYIHLLTDIKAGTPDISIVRCRNELVEELKLIYKFAPDTSSRAYKAAQNALQVNEEMTFSDEEVDKFLPSSLHSRSS